MQAPVQGGGRVFRQGKVSGEHFVLQSGAEITRLESCCACWAISCSLGRQLTFCFCREVLVLVYCMSGSVFMQVCIPIFFPCVSCVSQRMVLCTQYVSQKIFLCSCFVSQGLLQLYTRHQNLGIPKFSPYEFFSAEFFPLKNSCPPVWEGRQRPRDNCPTNRNSFPQWLGTWGVYNPPENPHQCVHPEVPMRTLAQP